MKDINLLLNEDMPAQDAPSGTKQGVPAKWVLLIVSVFAFALATIIVPLVITKVIDLRIGTLKQQVADQKYNEVKSLNSIMDSVQSSMKLKQDILDNIEGSTHNASEVLYSVMEAVPVGCTITNFNYEGSKVTITLYGKTTDIQAMEFLSNIDRLELFERKNDDLIITSMGGAGEITITMNIKGVKGE